MSWEPLNLANLEERPPIRPTIAGLVYPGKRHVFSGPQESAKTLAAYMIGLEEVRRGGIVLLIDFEMGRWDARDRLRELGASDDDLEQVLYVEPESPANTEIVEQVLGWSPTLVVIDAAAGAYDLQGLDDNKRADVERFAATYVRPFWLQEVATIVIDHVVKNSDNRGRYAIGSERKVGGADVHLGFEAVTPLHRGGHGLVKVTTHKDRFGWLPRPRAALLELASDPETHAITWTFKPAEEQPDGFRPTGLMERVSRYLEDADEPMPRKAIEDAVKGKTDYVRLALDCLLREGFVEERPGPRGARLCCLNRRFREDDLAPTSPLAHGDDLAPTSPLAPAATSLDLAPPPLGGEVAGRGAQSVENGAIPVLGDAMFPALLAESERAGHVTEDERSTAFAVHKLIEETR